MKKIKIFMGIPSLGERHDSQNYYLRRCEKNFGDKIEFVYPEIYVGRLFHDCARNSYVEQFLASDCDILWFLDSDIVPPERLLDIVADHSEKWDMAGAPYPVWMQQQGFDGPQITWTVYKTRVDGDPKKIYPAPIPEGGTEFVEGIATGCIFIKRHVFEKLQKPYFEFKYDPLTREMTEGEDLGFCIKTHALGYKFYIDYSMKCHHFKKVSLLDVSNTIELQKNMVIDECDREIRRIVAKQQLAKLNKPKLVQPTQSRLILPK